MKLTGRLDGIREGMYRMNELIASKLRALGLNARTGKGLFVTAVPLRVISDSLSYA